jgi:tRNA pseudouridine38-40 synthase
VISLKLIIEDSDIVKKINNALSPQIRVWGIERTIGSFSCYQACDSRWYEYLIPTHCFLPPHPNSFMGRKLVELAEEVGDMDGYSARQEDVADFWDNNERSYIQPLLNSLDESIRGLVKEALYKPVADRDALEDDEDDVASLVGDNSDIDDDAMDVGEESMIQEVQTAENTSIITEEEAPNDEVQPATASDTSDQAALNSAIKALKVAYIRAKHAYRISPARLARVREIFTAYKGTHNFHNYTVRKSANDPSAKRHILSFSESPEPILIGDTEWLSLKVHGQSFMMHQIRKMVGMATLMVRCGTPVERLNQSFSSDLFSIPKAPGLGLLLECPVFDSYNQKATEKFERAKIEFTKYEKEIEEFKRREIYDRIFREEEEEHVYVSPWIQSLTYVYILIVVIGSIHSSLISTTSRNQRSFFSAQKALQLVVLLVILRMASGSCRGSKGRA